jgi:DNA-binding transcriptional LysR family regulator
MELRHLRHFLAVADALSYSRAAETLHMAASPLSRSIQQLEHDLGGRFSTGGRDGWSSRRWAPGW